MFRRAGSLQLLALRKLWSSGDRNSSDLDERLFWQDVSRIIRAVSSSHLHTVYFLGMEEKGKGCFNKD